MSQDCLIVIISRYFSAKNTVNKIEYICFEWPPWPHVQRVRGGVYSCDISISNKAFLSIYMNQYRLRFQNPSECLRKKWILGENASKNEPSELRCRKCSNVQQNDRGGEECCGAERRKEGECWRQEGRFISSSSTIFKSLLPPLLSSSSFPHPPLHSSVTPSHFFLSFLPLPSSQTHSLSRMKSSLIPPHYYLSLAARPHNALLSSPVCYH